MANKTHKHLLTLTRPQLVALATQKGVAQYHNARVKTKGQLIALLRDVEGVLTPVKTWEEADATLDNDQRSLDELAASLSAVTTVAEAFATDLTAVQAAAAGCSGRLRTFPVSTLNT